MIENAASPASRVGGVFSARAPAAKPGGGDEEDGRGDQEDAGRRSWFTRRRLMLALGIGAGAALLFFGGRWIDVAAFHAWTKELPALAVAGLVFALPFAGFPVSALHLAAGLRFEFWTALAVVATATLAQHVAAWTLARALPARFFKRFSAWREKLAGAGHREAAVLCCLLPGMPYSVQLYLLPVMGAPLRVLCLVSVPLHSARATVTILLGSISDELTPARVAGLVVYYLFIFTLCGFALRRMRRALAARRAATGRDAVR